MKVCVVVKNSIWYDPRVKKQIYEYINKGNKINCVGVKDPRYDKDEVKKIPCPVSLVGIDEKYFAPKRTLLTKIIREMKTNSDIYKSIISTKVDIIHANDLNALIPAYRASKKLNCILIYDTHEIFVENPWIAQTKIVKFVWETYEKFLIKKADKVVAVSYAAAEYFANKYKISTPLVVTNAVRKQQHINIPIKKSLKKQVLNHGQFYEGRGYDIMVNSAKLLCEYNDLVLVLRGFGSMERMLHNQVSKENIQNVIFEPPVKIEELIPKAAEAWVGVAITEAISLNFELSVSNKIFEYAAAGIPVIMSDIPEHRYLNDAYNFGIILKENTPECFAKAVKTLYNSTELYLTLSQNSHKLSKDINWESEFEKLLNVENELLKNEV